MQVILSAILCLLSTWSILGATYQTPPPTYEAKDYTQWNLKHTGKSKRANINVNFKTEEGADDYISLIRLDLVGNSYDRGYAHGFLLAKGKQKTLFSLSIKYLISF